MWSTAHSLQLSLVPVLLKSCDRENVHMVSNKTGKQHLLLCFFHSVIACCQLDNPQACCSVNFVFAEV